MPYYKHQKGRYVQCARKWMIWRFGLNRARDRYLVLPKFKDHFNADFEIMAKKPQLSTTVFETITIICGNFNWIVTSVVPPGFDQPCSISLPQLLWKFRSWVMQGQVTRSGQVTPLHKNITVAPHLQCLKKSYEMNLSEYEKVISDYKKILSDFLSVTSSQSFSLPLNYKSMSKIKLYVLCFNWSLCEWNCFI